MSMRSPDEIAQIAVDVIESAESVMGGFSSKTGSLAAIRESVRQAQEEAYAEGYRAGQSAEGRKMLLWSVLIVVVGNAMVYGVLGLVIG